MAPATVPSPVARSPTAKTGVSSRPSSRSPSRTSVPSGKTVRSGDWPRASSTRWQASSKSEPSTSRGARRPESSSSPSSMRRQVSTHSPLSRKATGWVRNEISTPSASAPSTSSAIAGISRRVRR